MENIRVRRKVCFSVDNFITKQRQINKENMTMRHNNSEENENKIKNNVRSGSICQK
jgi:hypothetical protein